MATHNDSKWITRFNVNITSNSNKVFSNGRQQLEVSVGITPKVGIELTEEQLNSIRLVTLSPNGNFEELTSDLKVSTERDTRFEYYAATGGAPSSLTDISTLHRKFYVSSTRPGGSLDKIYALIDKDENTTYSSYTSTFNSSAVIESITPLNFRREHMTLSVEHSYDESVISSTLKWDEIDFNVWTLSLPRGFRIVESIPHGAPGGQPYYQKSQNVTPWYYYLVSNSDLTTNRRYINYIHYAFKPGPAFYFNEHGAHGGEVIINRRPGTMTFLRVELIVNNLNLQEIKDPSVWELLDQYGNSHVIEMTQIHNGNGLDLIVR